ncbi:MAG: TlpA family protein disulfide reductase [Gemmatirosa sp.]
MRRLPWREGALLVLAVGGGLWLGLRQSRGIDDVPAGVARAATMAFGPGAGVAALTVRTVDGRITPLAKLGEPAVVMVVSQSCGVCKEALADFGRMANGRPLPRLWLVTLEGAALGAAMADGAHVRGAVLAGPAVPAAEALFTFQIQGTPTFLALDAEGRVRRVFPGYPGREVMAPWVELMAGARDAL